MIFEEDYYKVLMIRKFEEKLLELYGENKIHGTIHTSIGQEFSALAFAGQVRKSDYVFSNHRCHGHYLAFTEDHHGLLAEILGYPFGVCGGNGGSQHLCNGHFFSNGIQGGMLPVAAGLIYARKMSNADDMKLLKNQPFI